jgi:hypothetical protein
MTFFCINFEYQKKNTMKPSKNTKKMISALGAGARMVYLEQHPHGFSINHKVHVSKKTYKRLKKVQHDD